jgi:shikimate kinase
MKIILIGFMGTGKTSVATQIGSMLQWPVVEMDQLVFERTNSTSMHEVFAKGGELLLRESEIAISKTLANADKIVISTGAGVVMNKINVDYLKQCNGKTFWLNGAFSTIAARLANDTSRPLFTDLAAAKSLYDFRLPLYLKYADATVNIENKSVEAIAHEIVNAHRKGHHHGE